MITFFVAQHYYFLAFPFQALFITFLILIEHWHQQVLIYRPRLIQIQLLRIPIYFPIIPFPFIQRLKNFLHFIIHFQISTKQFATTKFNSLIQNFYLIILTFRLIAIKLLLLIHQFLTYILVFLLIIIITYSLLESIHFLINSFLIKVLNSFPSMQIIRLIFLAFLLIHFKFYPSFINFHLLIITFQFQYLTIPLKKILTMIFFILILLIQNSCRIKLYK